MVLLESYSESYKEIGWPMILAEAQSSTSGWPMLIISKPIGRLVNQWSWLFDQWVVKIIIDLDCRPNTR